MSYVRITEFTGPRNRSVDTPWWHRLKQHEWFDRQFVRTLMKPL